MAFREVKLKQYLYLYVQKKWPSLLLKPAHLIMFLISFLLFVLLIPAYLLEGSARKETERLKIRLNELSHLASEYKTIRAQMEALEKKVEATSGASVARVMDDILSSLNIKAKLKSLKLVSAREIDGMIWEETAELQIEKASLNELVNLFYRVAEGEKMIALRRVNIRKSFEREDLLDITMTVSLFTRK